MTMVVEGEVLDVLPPPVEEKVSAMQRWTPDQQVDHVTELLVQSNVGLLVAIAAQDLPGIMEAKAKAAGIEKIAKQLHISKEMQSHAAEFVRRAERGLGVGIREAQARGEVETCSEGKARGSLVRDQVVTYDKVKPKPTDFASKHELTNTHGGIYDLADGVSDEQFEEAITEARAEGNLSRANVARRCKTKAQSQKEVIDGDDPLIDADVAPAPVVKKTARARRTIEMLSVTTANLALSVADIDPDEVDKEQLAKEISIIFESLGTIRSFLRKVNEQ